MTGMKRRTSSNTAKSGLRSIVGKFTFLMIAALAVGTAWGAYNSVAITYDYNWTTKNFIYNGSIDPATAYASVRLTCGLNVATLNDNPMVLTAQADANGEFSITIPNAADGDTFRWKLELIDGNGDADLYQDDGGQSEFTKSFELIDQGRVTYTWTGNGDGRSWADVDNWAKNVNLCKGYPGVKNTYYWDTIIFNTDADVDLDGKTYGIRDGGGNLQFGQNINVTLRNGLLNLNYNGGTYTLGASGTTLTFDRFAVMCGSLSDTQYPTVDFAAGTTMKFVGTSTSDMNWKPTQNTVNFIFQDGTIKMRYSTDTTIYSQNASRTLITNAIWQTTAGNVSKGTAFITTFLDGPDRQAQFVCSGLIDLRRYYVIRIPKGGHSDATIKASTLSSDTNVGAFIVYVDDYLDDDPVPLVKFTTTDSTNKNNNNSRMTTQLSNAKTGIALYVRTGDTATPTDTSSYTDVMAKRNARLVWDNVEQTLYYQQDKVKRHTILCLK